MRRKHWLTLVVLFALADCALLAILLSNFVVPSASASLPATYAFATYQSGEIAPVTIDPTATPVPSPTGEAPPPAVAEVITYTYTVVEGDTLWDIAWRFNVSMATLVAANPGINPELLHPGDALIIPALFGPVETLTPTSTLPFSTDTPSPAVEPSATPTPLATPTLAGPVMAQVSADGERLRFRQSPGTAGQILAYLHALTPLTLLGRTEDNVWVEVIIPGGDQGWVMAKWLDLAEGVNLAGLPVTAVPVDASPAPPPSTRAPTQVPPTVTPRPTSAGAATPTTGMPSPTSPAPTTTNPPALPPPTETATPIILPTPAPTQVPIYPYVSGISEHARQIFLQGQALGSRAEVFSKIGDSITVSPVFLIPIGTGNYQLHEYSYLQPAVDYYSTTWARTSNSFSNSSLAAKVGWTSGAVLNPANADPVNCFAGESPLACEYRAVKPAVAIIMLGTNDVPGVSTAVFERNMRRIIETTISMGVIPVVSTIPPMHRVGIDGRVEEFNAILARLTREYDVPLVDYWSALQGLPNDGLGSDGVHPSWAPDGNSANFTPEYLQYGMTVRNLTALWALDAVWKSALHP